MPSKHSAKAKKKVAKAKTGGVSKAKKKIGCPVFKVSESETPYHYALLKKAKADGHSLKGLTRQTDKAAIRRNRGRSQSPIRAKAKKSGTSNKSGGPGTGYNYDEFPYASTHQGGFGATVMRNPEDDNQTAGRNLGAFYASNNIGEGDSYDIQLDPT